MRAIFLTKHIQDLADDYADNLFLKRPVKFIKPLPGLRTLLAGIKRKRTLHADYQAYVTTLIRLHPLLNKIRPAQFQKLHDKFFVKFAGVELNKSVTINKKKKKFYKHLTAAMRYDAVRDKDFLPFAKKMGIRSCVYCNANYAVSWKIPNGMIAKYELDHFRPQSVYPYLCTNFFNLYPVCANCNKSKSDIPTSFSLYTTDPNKIFPFSFTLEKRSIVKYMLSQDFEDLQIKFHAPDHPDHDRIFKISSTYGALKDAVEELIWKQKSYNPLYLKGLSKSFNNKFDYKNFNRLILGNYDQPSDIHKRPLSKITQDIARQLGILK